MTLNACAIIPSRNHVAALRAILERLAEAGLPVFLIDDGSNRAARDAIAALAAAKRGVTLHRFDTNQGKGGAVMKGFALAAAAGYTHAVQVDADGQHDLAALPRLLSLAAAHPDALILGTPAHDQTTPLARRIGRWITHFWVAVELLSPRIIDTMCGFRVYPLAPVMALLGSEPLGRRMDFDIEIAVRLVWRGVPVVTAPVRVTYPPGNTSNFDALRDNWRITRMHARLVLERLGRLPGFRRRAVRPETEAAHWSGLAERGAYWGLRLLAGTYRLTGRSGCLAAMLPVALYFHVTGREQRRASRLFLERIYAAQGETRRPGWSDGLRHSLGFARRMVDTFIGWAGGIEAGSIELVDKAEMDRVFGSGRGIVLIVSHFGNVELTRASLDHAQRSRLTLLVHTRHAENYARLLRRFRPEAALDTLQVTEVNPGTVIALKEKVERGGWVAIAGDRSPVGGDGRVSRAHFLGHDAAFPQGPYILAHLLECPVYLMFCLRENGRHRLHFERFAERVSLPRGDKEAALAALVQRYARRLEAYCLRDPFQWYNFFDFWAEAGAR
jgi:predicted LPLAT superfamily acyltransferase/glycosyltransferase involved in cell wall biosynthesis